MTDIKTPEDRALQIARDVLRLSKNTLNIRMRFLDLALNELQPASVPKYTIGTDGKYLYFGPGYILRTYRQNRDAISRAFLHSLLHCILRHMYFPSDPKLWGLCCDITVESIIMELEVFDPMPGDTERRRVIENLKSEMKLLTPEKLMTVYANPDFQQSETDRLSELFRVDDHTPWYTPMDNVTSVGYNGEQPLPSDGSSDDDSKDGDGQPKGNPDRSQLSSSYGRWTQIGRRMGTDLDTMSKDSWGDSAGGLTQNLERVNREKTDYSDFLRKFAVKCEVMKLSDDEFDQNFYMYGLELYGRMPLIEPLEYKEAMRIRDFVIAIDTSGSVSGDMVQAFLQKTFNILKSTDTFASKVNIHIIQCDADIQQDDVITCQEDLDRYFENVTLKGFGGTDFRPVFSYVDKLIDEKQLKNLKGLIYFTDGYGTYPSKMPAYQTAFVFLDDYQSELPQVPVWAIRLILSGDELKEEQPRRFYNL